MVYAQAEDPIFQDLMWGAGAGLRYFTPVGPIRLDWAVPLDRRPGDSPWQIYLSLGQSF
jgi:translocation and assembly module TamA